MIEFQNVCIRAGDFRLQDISFEISSGQYAVLMGRTGRGKTTILESLCGLRSIQSGKIIIRGMDVTSWPPADREIGYVPQDLALFPTFSVCEHLEFALRLRGFHRNQIDRRVNELAEMLGITHLLKRQILFCPLPLLPFSAALFSAAFFSAAFSLCCLLSLSAAFFSAASFAFLAASASSCCLVG